MSSGLRGKHGLPDFCKATHLKYKSLERQFQRWLCTQAEALKIPFGDRALQAETQASQGILGQQQQKRTTSGRKKSGKNFKRPPHNATTLQPPTEPVGVTLSTSQLLRLVQDVTAKISPSAIPKSILEQLDFIITSREKVATFYQAFSYFPDVKQSNLTHSHYLNVFRKARTILGGAISRTRNRAHSHSHSRSATPKEVVDLTSGGTVISLSLWEPTGSSGEDSSKPRRRTHDPEEWLPDHLKTRKFICSATPMNERPLTDFKLILDGDSEGEGEGSSEMAELQLAAWFFFYDLDELRAYITSVWEDYQFGTVSLLTASFLSTQAVEIVKEIETDFFAAHGHLLSGGRQHMDVIKAMFGLDPTLDDLDVLDSLKPRSEEFEEFIMYTPWLALYKFGTVLVPGTVPSARQGFFKDFDPLADRQRMTRLERHFEDFFLYMNHLPHVAAQGIFSGSGRRVRNNSKAKIIPTVDEHGLLRDFRRFLDGDDDGRGENKEVSRSIPPSLVFQWQIWRDSVVINQRELDRPYRELTKIAENIVHAAQSWIDSFDARYYAENDLDDMPRILKTMIVDRIRQAVLEDTFGKRKREGRAVEDNPAFVLFRMNPWSCGVAAYTILFQAHEAIVQVVNGSGYLTSLIQLYYYLRFNELVEAWPVMDSVVRICSDVIYPGGKPTKGRFYLAFCVSMGLDAAVMTGEKKRKYRTNDQGTGVFPVDMGGSVLAHIAVEWNYRVTDEVVALLFPKDGDEPFAVWRKGKNWKTRKTRGWGVGGKRCDPFSLLEALKVRVEMEMEETALTMDLFSAQRIALSVLQRWSARAHPLFVEYFGTGYQEEVTQIVYLTGWMFSAMEDDGKKKTPSGKEGLRETAKMMEIEAVRAFNEGREDVERGIRNGAKLRYTE